MSYTRQALVYLLLGSAVLIAVALLMSGPTELRGPVQLGLALVLMMALAGCLFSALGGRYFGVAAGSGVVVYVMVRLALTTGEPPALLPTGVAIAAEAALLLCLAWSARRVVKGVTHLEKSLALEAVPGFSRLVGRTELVQDLAHHQFHLAMRHGRSLSAVVLQLSPEPGEPARHDFGRLVTDLYELGSLAQLAADTFRRTDIAMKAQGQRKLILVCPETGPEGAMQLAEKVRLAAQKRLGQLVEYGIASFPSEALNLEELVHQADLKVGLQERPTMRSSQAGNNLQ